MQNEPALKQLSISYKQFCNKIMVIFVYLAQMTQAKKYKPS